ncbi:hypothetical protein [Lysobacter capsici]|uniref:hypothetical protein n=1 Tax=Lysobacter capsici TaxID=435897 RepID=UPI001BFFE9FA|nr:hypothetical protein [Lysobacter capsici]QWF17513.1 hypothetical protein KME82_01525 [Lysobacter capsici]
MFDPLMRLGLGGIPVTVVLSTLIASGWALSFFADLLLLRLLPEGPLRTVASVVRRAIVRIRSVNQCAALEDGGAELMPQPRRSPHARPARRPITAPPRPGTTRRRDEFRDEPVPSEVRRRAEPYPQRYREGDASAFEQRSCPSSAFTILTLVGLGVLIVFVLFKAFYPAGTSSGRPATCVNMCGAKVHFTLT